MTAPDHGFATIVTARFAESSALVGTVGADCAAEILAAADAVARAFADGCKVLLCGNGGSAADCQHLAGELVGRFSKEVERPGLPAIALTTDTSVITAYANDVGYDEIFERQVQAIGRAGDVLIAISASGESRNVLRAVAAARAAGLATVGLTATQGRLGEMADVAVRVPSSDTQHIQEALLVVEHVICELVESRMFGVASS